MWPAKSLPVGLARRVQQLPDPTAPLAASPRRVPHTGEAPLQAQPSTYWIASAVPAWIVSTIPSPDTNRTPYPASLSVP